MTAVLRGAKGRTQAALVSSTGGGETHVVRPAKDEGRRGYPRRREQKSF
jgi:hypothetical protein